MKYSVLVKIQKKIENVRCEIITA